jgi:hypothetical protein
MTASQIIEEIKRLDPKEQLGVIRFAYQLDAERKLSGNELSSLAKRMVDANDQLEAARIREIIFADFTGNTEMHCGEGEWSRGDARDIDGLGR